MQRDTCDAYSCRHLAARADWLVMNLLEPHSRVCASQHCQHMQATRSNSLLRPRPSGWRWPGHGPAWCPMSNRPGSHWWPCDCRPHWRWFASRRAACFAACCTAGHDCSAVATCCGLMRVALHSCSPGRCLPTCIMRLTLRPGFCGIVSCYAVPCWASNAGQRSLLSSRSRCWRRRWRRRRRWRCCGSVVGTCRQRRRRACCRPSWHRSSTVLLQLNGVILIFTFICSCCKGGGVRYAALALLLQVGLHARLRRLGICGGLHKRPVANAA